MIPLGRGRKGDEGRRAPRRETTAAYNPLTGNRRFYEHLEDGEVPREQRSLEAPEHEGVGQRSAPRGGRRP